MLIFKPPQAKPQTTKAPLYIVYASCIWLLSTGVSMAALPSSPLPPALTLDWQAKPATINNYCAGYYLPYEVQALDQDKPIDQQPLYSNADSSEYDQGVTHFKGNVEFRQGTQVITGDYARFDNNSGLVNITGEVKYRRQNMIMESTEANINTNTSEVQLNQAQLAIPKSELRASAESIDYHSDDTVTMNQGSFTFCPPGNNAWAIHSNKIDLDPSKGFGEAQHAILKIGVVPVFYLPWMSFPIDEQRRSGFLFPTLVRSSQMGLDLSTPYYLNLAPNYDALITPRFTEFRGTTLGAKLRHINANSEQDLYLNWAIEDPKSNQNRWLTEFNHAGQISPSLSTKVHLKRVSDAAVFDDYGYSRASNEGRSLISKVQLNYQAQSPLISSASVALITHQNLSTSTPAYDQLPYASLAGGSTSNYQQQALTANYQLELSRFTRDTEDLSGTSKITGTRLHLQPSLGTAWSTDYSFIKPKLSLPITHYQLKDTTSTTISASKTRILPQFEVDSGLLFERNLNAGYTQTLEPRIYYAYAPFRQQDDITIFDTSLNSKPLYQVNRFSGYDRIGDTNRITLGVTSQFLDAKGWQKAELSITQLHYLSDRQVQLTSSTATSTATYSPIYGHMGYQFTPYWSSSLDIDWSASSLERVTTSASMKYQPHNSKIIDLKYTETVNSTQQGEVSLIWPLGPQWTLVAKHKEDLLNQQLQDEIVGVEYANCCWKGRLVSRRWLVDENIGIEHGIFFELSLKGLGSSSKQLTSGNQVRMADFMKGITGYNERTQ